MSRVSQQHVRIVVLGASGRMGRSLTKLLSSEAQFQCVGEVNLKSDWSKVDPSNVDVVIDFSNPRGFQQALNWCVRHKIAFVSGTTGLKAADKKLLQSAGRKIAALHAPNMSLGIAAMNGLLSGLRQLRDWDFQIEEVHHRRKKDSPSGTALQLQNTLQSVLGKKLPPIAAVRGGGVPGVHRILCLGPDETLVIEHSAFNREVFARGALAAALALVDKGRVGLYELRDLIGKS